MATDTPTYDYTTDPQFLGAPPDIQHAYLSANNPNYAKADPDLQKAYISHLNKDPHGERAAAINPPRPNLISGSPLGNAITKREAEEPSERAIGEATGVIGAAAPAMVSPVTTAGAIAGGMVGAPVVSSGARRVVGAFGGGKEAQDTAGTIGGYAGGIGGSILGGGMGANLEEVPPEFKMGGFKIRNPFHNPDEPSLGTGAPEPGRGEFESNRETQLVGEGKLAKLPIRVPKPGKPDVTPMTESPYYDKFAASRAAAKETAANANINRPGWTAKLPSSMPRSTAEFGTPIEGSNQRVSVVPEPNPLAPGEKPGAQWSVPRRSTLVQNAKRGKEGAGTVISQTRNPVIYEPKGVVGANTRTPEADAAIRGAGTIGTPPKGPNGLKLTTDSLGVRWASSPDSPNPVSIPKSVPENQVGDYATTKLAEQAEMSKGIKGNVESANVTVDDLADAIQKKTGNDPAKAMDMAKHYKAAAEGAPNYNGEERRHAAEWIGRYMGPERRKP